MSGQVCTDVEDKKSAKCDALHMSGQVCTDEMSESQSDGKLRVAQLSLRSAKHKVDASITSKNRVKLGQEAFLLRQTLLGRKLKDVIEEFMM